MKRGLQWNIPILSARPRNLHCSVIGRLKLLENRRFGAQILQAQVRSSRGSSLLCNWLHFLEETGRHVENKASHGDIFCDPGM